MSKTYWFLGKEEVAVELAADRRALWELIWKHKNREELKAYPNYIPNDSDRMIKQHLREILRSCR